MATMASRERMLSRLAALDLARVFDVNGTGLIEPVVLIRSLKIWDSAVFTDDNIADLFTWAKLEKGGEHLNIQDIVRFVKARAPKMPKLSRRRSGSRDSHASGYSTARSETMSFSAAPRSCRTREPDEEGARGGAEPSQRAPQAGSTSDPVVDAARKDDEQEVVESAGAAQDVAEEKEESEPPPLNADISDPALSTESSEPVEGLRTPSPRLTKRLAGLNILKVLDIEGNGLINKQVLKRSLKVFDPEVFTEEGVNRLIHAATRGKPAEGHNIRIVDLAQYMGETVFFEIASDNYTSSEEDATSSEAPKPAEAKEPDGPTPVEPKPEAQPPDETGVPKPEAEEPEKEKQQQPAKLEAAEDVPAIAVVPPEEADGKDGPSVPQVIEEDDQFQGIGEAYLNAALDDADFTSNGLLTARTEVDSTANDLADTRIAMAELRDGASGCSIDRPEYRGITLRQLRRLMHYIEEHCERESWYDPETGAPLSLETLDLFCLVEWVLKPATKDQKCSFVELIADKPSHQRPRWYVSHGHGSVFEFFECLCEHASRHGFTDDVAYWVDTYAQNPWEEKQNEGAWEKALAVSQGTVQVIGNGPVAYLEVGSHSLADVDTDPFYGVRPFRG